MEQFPEWEPPEIVEEEETEVKDKEGRLRMMDDGDGHSSVEWPLVD